MRNYFSDTKVNHTWNPRLLLLTVVSNNIYICYSDKTPIVESKFQGQIPVLEKFWKLW